MGVQLGRSRARAPRLVRLRLRREAFLRARGDKRRLALLRAMHARWPFFRTLLDQHGHGAGEDRTSAIASRYAELVADRALRAHGLRSHPTRVRRHARGAARDHRRSATLLEDNPSLARSLRNRIPYIDPLNHLQVDLLRRLARARRRRRACARAIHLTINGIAAGLRNSG